MDIGQANANRRRLEQQLIAGFTFPKGILGLTSLGDIVGGRAYDRLWDILDPQGIMIFPDPRLTGSC